MDVPAITVVDASGAEVALHQGYKRIVSLVPSITESLIELGAADRLVGRTRYCIHPRERVRGIPTLGGTKDPDLEKIVALRPDLVLANREENLPDHIAALRSMAIQVYVNEPRSVSDALEMVQLLGHVTNTQVNAAAIIAEARRELESQRSRKLRVAVPIWRDPWMLAAGDTYIAGMLRTLGCTPVFPEGASRYPEVSIEAFVALECDLVLLPSEPWHFKQSDANWLSKQFADAGKQPRIALCAGEDLMWFGTRTSGALRRLKHLLS